MSEKYAVQDQPVGNKHSNSVEPIDGSSQLPQPIVMQPIPTVSGAIQTAADCPPGLEYLLQLDNVIIKQKVDLLEAFIGWEEANRYGIMTPNGNQLWYAFEKSNCCARLCCGNRRGFKFTVVDNFNREVFFITRPFKCCACGGCFCCSCCHFEVTIKSPDDRPMGYVQSRCAVCRPNYAVLDGNSRKDVMSIYGPCFCMLQMKNKNCPCCILTFNIEDADNGHKIGAIKKVWAGLARELFTDSDSYNVTFPQEMDISKKTSLVGATLLVDFMYFENDKTTKTKVERT